MRRTISESKTGVEKLVESWEYDVTLSRTSPSQSLTDKFSVYAHYDTGHYTAVPRQVVPGEPAKSLERALGKTALTIRSTAASLPSVGTANLTAGDSLSVGAHSRPGTPFSRGRSSLGTTSSRSGVDFSYSAGLRGDNDFLRVIVEDTQREKRLLQEKVTSLENEKSQLTTDVDKIKEDFNTMLREREALQATNRMLQFLLASTRVSTHMHRMVSKLLWDLQALPPSRIHRVLSEAFEAVIPAPRHPY